MNMILYNNINLFDGAILLSGLSLFGLSYYYIRKYYFSSNNLVSKEVQTDNINLSKEVQTDNINLSKEVQTDFDNALLTNKVQNVDQIPRIYIEEEVQTISKYDDETINQVLELGKFVMEHKYINIHDLFSCVQALYLDNSDNTKNNDQWINAWATEIEPKLAIDVNNLSPITNIKTPVEPFSEVDMEVMPGDSGTDIISHVDSVSAISTSKEALRNKIAELAQQLKDQKDITNNDMKLLNTLLEQVEKVNSDKYGTFDKLIPITNKINWDIQNVNNNLQQLHNGLETITNNLDQAVMNSHILELCNDPFLCLLYT